MARIGSAHTLELEQLLRQRRALAGGLLSADAFDRWGPKEGPEYDAMVAQTELDSREHRRVTQALETRATAIRAEDPQAIADWADAHIDLLTRFLATNESDPQQDTACFVAKHERDAWHEVKRGEKLYVDENCYYIHLSPDDLAEWFGS